MKKSSKHPTIRERRERVKRSNLFSHALIVVVALIECILLLVFTTYSWIESSSSLKISTGDKAKGLGSIAVAHNLSYQLLVSAEGNRNVKLVPKRNSEEVLEDGYFRTVQHFNYSKSTSYDGINMFFRNTGGATAYRAQDTSDYNTTYTYLDFEVKNITNSVKAFYFKDNNLFDYTGHSEFDSTTYQYGGENYTYQQIILNAMRISFCVTGGSPQNIQNDALIVSMDPRDYSPVNTTGGATTTISYDDDDDSTGLRYHSVDHHVFSDLPNSSNQPLFTSDANEIDRVSLRIWFDERDAVYSSLDGTAKANIDAALNAAEIKLRFTLLSDTIDYDTIYFDDYAFSNRVNQEGKFVTDEDDNCRMYLHAFDAKQNAYTNYEMTRVETSDTPANRWAVTVPIRYCIDGGTYATHFMTGDNPTKWNNSFFYYGQSNDADEEKILYKWNLSALTAHMEIDTVDDPDEGLITVIKDKCKYFRNLGVVRDETNYNKNVDETTIQGFLQYDHYSGDDHMKLINIRDEATSLTGAGYNASIAAAGGNPAVKNYQYISDKASEQYDVVESGSSGSGGGTVEYDYSALINALKDYTLSDSGKYELTDNQKADLDRITYFDVPSGWKLIFGMDKDKHTSDDYQPRADAQTCYYAPDNGTMRCQTGPNIGYGIVLNSTYLPAGTNTDGYVRVYFYKGTNLDGNDKWGTGHTVYISVNSYNNNNAWVDERSTPPLSIVPWTSEEQIRDYVSSNSHSLWDAIKNGTTSYTNKGGSSGGGDSEYKRYYGGLYLNLRDGVNYESSSQKTVSTYYDTSSSRFMAYVPTSWLSGGFDIHYNECSGYYKLSLDKLRWATGSAGTSTEYSLLGYTDDYTLAQLNTVGVSDIAVGTGVGTWSNVRRIEFSNELLYSNVGSGNRYKLGTEIGGTSLNYYMVPSEDDLINMHFFAYVPDTYLSMQSTNHKLSFIRKKIVNSVYTTTGVWVPQENINYTEKTYYAVDAVANESGATSTNRGWFHLAVFVDGTFENIVYDTLCDSDEVVNGAKLQISTDGLTYYDVISNTVTTTEVQGETQRNVETVYGTDVIEIGTTRWIIPTGSSSSYTYFRWIPYPDTETYFDYSFNNDDGVYCVVTEIGNATIN